MRKTMMVLGVLVCATLLVNPAMACDGKDAKQASNEGASCSKSAAKAAYAETLEKTGCEKTAQAAYKNTLAENVYAKSYADTNCSKTAQKAAYDAVKSAQAAYDGVTKTAGATCDRTKCDKGAAESASEETANTNVKLASKNSE